MADARKRAEEWLGRYGDDDPLTLYGLENSRVEAARLLRALLAEEPGAANFIRCAVPRGECCHQRIPAVLPLEAPECNDGDDCCRYCGRGLQPCGACKPEAPNPGERQCYFCDCTTTHTPEECMRRSRRKPAPLPPEVREAAERPADAVLYWTFQVEWGDGHRPTSALYQSKYLAELERERELQIGLDVGPVVAVSVPLAVRRGA